jgi:hypothetical protein
MIRQGRLVMAREKKTKRISMKMERWNAAEIR